jgi:imidazolonepropionase
MRVAIRNVSSIATPYATSARRFEVTETSGRLGLAISDGVIEFVGQDSQLAGPFEREFDAGGRLATPGFIDAHTHLVFGGNRAAEFEMRSAGMTYEEIAAAGGGIRSSMESTRAASEGELVESALERLNWMMANGTTVVEAKSGYGLSLESELKILKVLDQVRKTSRIKIVSTLLAAHAVPPEFAGRPDDYIALVCDEIIPATSRLGLAEYVDVFVERSYFDASHARKVAATARLHGLGLRLHVDQLGEGGGAALAAELGADSADHLEYTNTGGIASLSASSTVPVLLPASVFTLRKSKYPDARTMIEAGLPVALATDFNPGSSPTPSLPFVMAVACTQMGMSPAEAFLGVTAHAALSLHLETTHGQLTSGFEGNIVLWDAHSIREIPYWIGAPICHRVFIGGKLVYERL